MTIYSLSEIDSNCKKAVRGAGFSWGHAEETGKAMRWLASHGLPGPELLAAYLDERNTTPERFQLPTITASEWHPDNGKDLCPILTGACLFDKIIDGELNLRHVAYPLMLSPYLAFIAQAQNRAFEISWNKTRLQFHGDLLQIPEDHDLATAISPTVVCKSILISNSGNAADCHGLKIDENIWAKLNRFAFKTYVPASDASRKGAGPAD